MRAEARRPLGFFVRVRRSARAVAPRALGRSSLVSRLGEPFAVLVRTPAGTRPLRIRRKPIVPTADAALVVV